MFVKKLLSVDYAMYSVFQGILFLYLMCQCHGILKCGDGQLSEPSGYISSPGFPNLITASGNCKWKIHLGTTDFLTISFETFDFASTSTHSRLAIYPSLGVNDRTGYSVSDPPTSPYFSASHGSTIVISLTLEASDVGSKFNLTYIRGPKDLLQSCPSHQFKCSNGKCILPSWVCNGENECEDGSDEAQCSVPSPTPHEGSCPNQHFACTSSSTGHMTCFQEIRKCDGHQDCENGDDEESCASVCHYLLEGTVGSFSSPNYPGNYYSDLDCEWRISLGQEGIVQLRFVQFDLESGFYRDYVKVFEDYIQPSTGAYVRREIDTYYGSMQDVYSPPTVVEASGSSLVVQFHTDNNINRGGFNATFQKKGYCIDHQKSCGEDDNNCYDVDREMCDGRYACQRGQDEVGCGNCSAEKIPCQGSGRDCFLPEDRCNGFTTCSPGGEDEQFCTAEICGEAHGLFLCKDGTCIQEKWMCDVQVDCEDGSDESDCPSTVKVITAAVIGSLVCGMLLVAALSCTCKLYQLRQVRRDGGQSPSRSSYYIYGGENDQREAPPSYSATMASPHYGDLQRAFVEGVRGGTTVSHGINRRRSRFLRMLSRGSQGELNAAATPEAASNRNTPEGGSLEQETHDIQNSVNVEGRSSESSDPQNTLETSSFTTSDTDSETTQEVVQQAHLDHQILNAAANIHRIRVVNRILQRQATSRRSPDHPPSSEGPTTSSSSTPDTSVDGTSGGSSSLAVTPELSSTSQDHAGHGHQGTPDRGEITLPSSSAAAAAAVFVTPDEDEFPREHDPAIIVGVHNPEENRDDVQLLDDV
ncbi:low-density lipoprotein receptor-related protein 12-like [Apostichopus japonicus]|uniref:low-density lipoprotein receptor-related protein 12-like n=1 Tax=Stichopus japonicus TaxID=307972 RepID=UPI003AB7B880